MRHTYVLIPHFISRRAISNVKHSRLPGRFHRDEKIARMHTERRNNPKLVPRFNPFHLSGLNRRQREEERERKRERASETLVIVRRTFRMRMTSTRSVLLTRPFPLLQVYKISRRKQAQVDEGWQSLSRFGVISRDLRVFRKRISASVRIIYRASRESKLTDSARRFSSNYPRRFCGVTNVPLRTYNTA